MNLAVIVFPAPGGMQAITLLCLANSFRNWETSVSWYGRSVGISIILFSVQMLFNRYSLNLPPEYRGGNSDTAYIHMNALNGNLFALVCPTQIA